METHEAEYGDLDDNVIDEDSDDDDDIAVHTLQDGNYVLVSGLKELPGDLDEAIEERCEVKRPQYQQRVRKRCHEFCSWDRDLEVWSDDESALKSISGYLMGD